MEEHKSTFEILTDKPTEKRLSGRPRRRWLVNTRIKIKEIGIDTRIWVDSARDRDNWRALTNTALNLRVP